MVRSDFRLKSEVIKMVSTLCYRQYLKISGEIQVFPGENEGFPGEIFHYFSQKKRQLIMEKNKKWAFFFTCTLSKLIFHMRMYLYDPYISRSTDFGLWPDYQG